MGLRLGALSFRAERICLTRTSCESTGRDLQLEGRRLRASGEATDMMVRRQVAVEVFLTGQHKQADKEATLNAIGAIHLLEERQ